MNSRNYRIFKREMGQANHYLITICVGLDAVKDGAKKKEDFHAMWNPKDAKISAERSMLYARKASLAWAVDNLDMYLRMCNRKPVLYGKEESTEIADTKHSVYKRYLTVIKHHTQIDSCQKAFVDLMICWRNNLIHFDADNSLQNENLLYLKNEVENDICIEKYNLDIRGMLQRFNNHECPTFKEVATMISMTIHFVKTVDELLLANVQQDIFLDNVVKEFIKQNKGKTEVFCRRNADENIVKKRIMQMLCTCQGISEDFYDEKGMEYLKLISKMTEEEVLDYSLVETNI